MISSTTTCLFQIFGDRTAELLLHPREAGPKGTEVGRGHRMFLGHRVIFGFSGFIVVALAPQPSL